MTNELKFVANTIARATERTGPDGRLYLVAPGVALVVGVVGNEFVPSEEIAKAAFGFNGRPLPLYHPMVGNEYVSCNSPELHNQLSIGNFWGATFDGSKLKGEYWIDIAKAQAMGGDALAVLQALQANKQIETSTAYGRDFDATPGEYQGKPYVGIARNLVPDHVAVLVSERGKCSIKDGCGLLANTLIANCDCQKTPWLATNDSAVEDQVRTGIMVAFYLSPTAATQLVTAVDGLPAGSEQVPLDQMHVTLAYLGKTDDPSTRSGEVSELDVMQQLASFAKYAPVVRAQVGGIGLFSQDNDGKQALWAQVDSPFLVDWRNQLCSYLPGSVANDHSCTPHITLAYVPTGQPIELAAPQPQELIFDAVALSWGNKTTIFPLQGEAVPITNSEDSMKDKEVAAAETVVVEPVKEPAKTEAKSTPVAGELLVANAANADQLIAVNAELASLKAQIADFAGLIAGIGGVDKMRDILTTTSANLQAMAANASREKNALINQLVGNARCAFKRSDLEKFDIDALGKLALSLQPADYSARSFAANRQPETQKLVSLKELNATKEKVS